MSTIERLKYLIEKFASYEPIVKGTQEKSARDNQLMVLGQINYCVDVLIEETKTKPT
jgi:hypothetical protein